MKELDEYKPLYSRFQKYFGYMNDGFKGKNYEIHAYNGGLFKADPLLDGLTITAWKDEESMLAFRNSGAHKEAMKDTRKVSHKYKTLHYESGDIPNWTQARQQLCKLDYRML